jgi:putative ABC transport system substrate-binding protein
VVRIFKGEKPGAIPSATVTKVQLMVNPAAAQAQGVTLPEAIIKSAAQVIK